MNEFYKEYTKALLKKIFTEYKNGNKENIKEIALELKELNKTMFLDKKLNY